MVRHNNKTYNLKIYGNKGKLQKLDELLNFWKDEVNKKIKIFWDFNNINSSYPPKEHTKGGRLVRDEHPSLQLIGGD